MSVYLLVNNVMHYAWGSATAIQHLMGHIPDGRNPWAELWMGAHPKASSSILVQDHPQPLNEWIAGHRKQALGSVPACKGGELPFLFKVLAAAEPLSIQVHPDEETAREGYTRENEQGVPLDSPKRNYRDPHAKPEMLLALEPFQALVGLRPLDEIHRLLRLFDLMNEFELATGETTVNQDTFRRFLSHVSRADSEHLAGWIGALLAQGPECPERRMIEDLEGYYHADPGVLAPLFLNMLTLHPGEAVYLPPGMPHAYIGGLALEIMGNSDNVLRGGLTPKHRDVTELVRAVDWQFEHPRTVLPRSTEDGEDEYHAPVECFRLSKLLLNGQRVVREVRTPQIVFVTDGTCELTCAAQSLQLGRGEAAFISADSGEIALEGMAALYRARVPE